MTELVPIEPAALEQALAAPSERLLVLYLWGPACPNCVIFKRRLPHLLQALADIPFDLRSLDVYTHPEIARRFAVHGIPHFLLFKDGKKLGKMSEFRGDNYWAQVIREHA